MGPITGILHSTFRRGAISRLRPESDANAVIVGNPIERPAMSIASTIALQSDGTRRNMIFTGPVAEKRDDHWAGTLITARRRACQKPLAVEISCC